MASESTDYILTVHRPIGILFRATTKTMHEVLITKSQSVLTDLSVNYSSIRAGKGLVFFFFFFSKSKASNMQRSIH